MVVEADAGVAEIRSAATAGTSRWRAHDAPLRSRRCRGTPGPRLWLGSRSGFVHEARDRGCTEVWVLADHDNDAGMATCAAASGIADGGGTVMCT